MCTRPSAGKRSAGKRPRRLREAPPERSMPRGDSDILQPQTMTATAVAQSIDQFRDRFSRITQEVARRIVGHEEIVNGTVTSLLAGGHVLLEGIPGVGKTSLVHTLADA